MPKCEIKMVAKLSLSFDLHNGIKILYEYLLINKTVCLLLLKSTNMITFTSNFYLFMFNQICIWLQITGSPEKRYPQRTSQQGTVSAIDLHLSLK